MTDFPSESLERSADALRRIAEALETIAAHLANPTITATKDGVWPTPVDGGPGNRIGERPLQVGDRVRDRTGGRGDTGRIHALRPKGSGQECRICWDNSLTGEPGGVWWNADDFTRIE